MSRQERKALLKMYEVVPSFACKPGCHRCCCPVPFTPAERAAVADVAPNPNPEPTVCEYLGEEGCRIYDRRPLICRMFGAIDDDAMRCPEGMAPERQIPKKESDAMSIAYVRWGAKMTRYVPGAEDLLIDPGMVDLAKKQSR